MGWTAQVIPVEQRGAIRPFVSLDDLERILDETPDRVPEVLRALRTVWGSLDLRKAPVYVLGPPAMGGEPPTSPAPTS